MYFNGAKKYNYMKQIIDRYFQESKGDRQKYHRTINHEPEEEVDRQKKNMRTINPEE